MHYPNSKAFSGVWKKGKCPNFQNYDSQVFLESPRDSINSSPIKEEKSRSFVTQKLINILSSIKEEELDQKSNFSSDQSFYVKDVIVEEVEDENENFNVVPEEMKECLQN